MPQDITDLLPDDRRLAIIDAFSGEDADERLAEILPAAFPASRSYIDAIVAAFSVNPPADRGSGTRTRLSREDRERILIALLASRGERLNLAVHIYVALGLGITPDEIVHILLLAGVYTGLPNFATAWNVVPDTFSLLVKMQLSEVDPLSVIKRLGEGFALPPADR